MWKVYDIRHNYVSTVCDQRTRQKPLAKMLAPKKVQLLLLLLENKKKFTARSTKFLNE